MQSVVLDDLAALVASAAPRADDVDGAVLSVLSEIAPLATVGRLLGTARSPSEPARLSAVVQRVADALASKPDGVPRADALRIVADFGHQISASTAVDLIGALAAQGADRELVAAVQRALELSPSGPGLLRAAAELAISTGEWEHAHGLLTRLGRADPTLSTTRFVQLARSRVTRLDHPSVRVALLSSFTVDPLAAFLDLECRALELVPAIWIAPFNSWGREMLGGGSGLEQFDPEIAFVSVAVDDLIPALAGPLPSDELRHAGDLAVDHLLSVARAFADWSPATLVVHSLYSAFPDPLGPAGGRDGPSRWEVLAGLNGRLAAGLRDIPRAYLLNLPEIMSRRRQGASDNPKMRHLARMRLAEHALGDLARAYAGYVAPLKGRTRKCIVVDLDNTLWGGIVGEDGPGGIRLGDTSPGSEYREFQRYLLGLTLRGILLAINSKNNEADALEVIRGHDAMVLRENAFSATRINWESKPNNMLSLARELGIGLDSLLFVDDSEKERALMRQTLPQVLTPEMPRDPALYRQTLESLPELQVLTVTEEDRTRTLQYAERRQREQLRVSTQSMDEYLRSLGVSARIATASDRTMSRVHQLFQRTNQFNLTTRRYEPGELSARAADPGWRVFTASVSDRFGDHGLVAAAVVQVTPSVWSIENLVMSCRVIGYGVEDALLAHIAGKASGGGAGALAGQFIPSKKNAPARDFYERHAFARERGSDTGERWTRDIITQPMTLPAWITVECGQ
jgi:FkbH-like protein